MKTSVVMHSPDRELLGVKIRQQSSTGHLNLSDLQAAYSQAQQKHGWVDKNLTMLLNSDQNTERLFYILENQGFIKLSFLSFTEQVEREGITNVLKSVGAYKTTGRGMAKTTWCDPYIWVLVAMELNPMLYAKTVVWLTDSLLINRIEAGDFYKGFTSALGTFPSVDFAKVARALNFIVFGRHEHGLRQTATSAELKELATLEGKMAFAIEMGYIRSQEELLIELRRVWTKKYDKRFLAATA